MFAWALHFKIGGFNLDVFKLDDLELLDML